MARKKSSKGRRKSPRRRRRGLGSVITVRPAMSGLGRSRRLFGLRGTRGLSAAPRNMMAALLGPLLGAGATAATILLLRSQIDPSRGQTQAQLVRFAPAFGFGAGIVTSIVSGMLGGMGPGATTIVGSGLTAGAFSAYDMIRQQSGGRIDAALSSGARAPLAPSNGAAAGNGTAGFGVIVPEFRGLPARTGAIVMEKPTPPGMSGGLGNRGQVINLGAVNPGVFGTPGF